MSKNVFFFGYIFSNTIEYISYTDHFIAEYYTARLQTMNVKHKS